MWRLVRSLRMAGAVVNASDVNGKTPGQVAYEEDVRRCPNYEHGEPRATWSMLKPWVQETWERDPTPRNYK